MRRALAILAAAVALLLLATPAAAQTNASNQVEAGHPQMADASTADTMHRDAKRQDAMSDETKAESGPPTLSDDDVTRAVENELWLARGVRADAIDVHTTDGVVTLSGTAASLLASRRAVRVAQMVRGARSVVDQVEVLASDLGDDEITNAVRARLAADPATESWEVGVRTSDGEVTLTGEVDSWAEKQLADRLASAVAGVRGVTNDLRVDYSADRSEKEIREDVASRLAWDARVDDGLIDVTVDGHDVRLSGTVGSAYERSLARDDAWVIGVADVDTRGLEIASWDRDRMLRHERFVSKDDADVADAVEDALLWDPRVSSFDVDVEVQDGLVTLSGVIDNLKAKRSAAQTAANTIGVQRVRNHLKVRPTEERDHVAIERDVRAALIRDPYVDRLDVEVRVDDGVARLSGDVSSYFERWQAEDLAARVKGVVGVENDLDVSYELPRYAETRFYDWDVVVSDADVAPTAFDLRGTNLADAEIREEVSDELFWSPFVDRDEISVQVNRGVVTLTGIVDSWSERNAATEEALEGGAKAVINRLDVNAAS